MKLVNRNAKANLILSRFVFCAMMVFLYSCGSGGGGDDSSSSGTGSPGTGSVSFGLALQDQGTVQALDSRAAQALQAFFIGAAVSSEGQFECQTETYEIATIEAQVFDENGELLAEGGPWDCEDRQGTIGGVEAGDGRIVKVSAIDESGKVVAEGKSDPVTVIAGQTVNAGTIILELVNSAPVADAGPDQTPFVDDTVTLDGSGSSDVDGDLLSYFWSFTSLPEGSEASLSDPTAVNPTFDVDVSGNYVAQLIVNDGTVNSDPDTVAINTRNSAPVANAGPDQTPFVDDTVTLDGSGSSDVDGDLLSYFWSFTSLPEGSEASLSDPTAVNPTFDVDVSGNYVAQLIVNDGTVNSDPDTVAINTRNSAPVANAGPDQTPFVDDTVTLDGSGSSDVDGDLLSYFWSFTSLPEGSEASLSDPTAVNPTFDVDVSGNYVAQLIVNDGTVNSDPDTVAINTRNSAPVANAGPDQTPFVDDTVTLDGSGSSDVDGDLLSYFWSFTSLPEGSEASLSDPTAVNPTFDVDVSGNYVAQLIVNDGTVNSDPDTVAINTRNSAPVANAGPDQTPFVDDTVTLDGSGSSDVDGDLLSYFWSFTSLPEGSEASLSDPTAVNPTFDVDVSGNYVAQLIVNDGTVNSDPDTVAINTRNSAPVANAGPDQTPFVDDTVTLDGSGSSDVDGDLLSYFWSFTSLPEGSEASLSDPTAVNPTFDVDVVFGVYVAQLIVNDGTVDSNPDFAVIEISSNDQPVFQPIEAFEVGIGQEIQFDVIADDPDPADILTISADLSDLPAGAAFSDNTDRTGTFRWTPGVDDFPRKVSSLTFLFGEFGGNLTIEINGDFRFLKNFSEINGSIIGGANVSVTNGFGQDNGEVSISGVTIDSFAIGGQELWVDDFCYPTGCVDFEDLNVGTIYQDNSSFIDSGANIFVNTSFESSSGTAIVENSGKAGGSGNEMRCDNIDLDFIFGYTVLFNVTDNGQPPLSDAMKKSFTWIPPQ